MSLLQGLRRLDPDQLPSWLGQLAAHDEPAVVSVAAPVTVVVVGALVLLWTVLLRRPRLDVPVLLADEMPSHKDRAAEYYNHPRRLLSKGYRKFADRVFAIDTNDGLKLVLPLRWIEELKNHPDLSFKASIDNDMLLRYTLFGGPPQHVITAVKASLNGVLGPINKIARARVPKLFGSHADWTPVQVHDLVLMVAGASSARVFHSTAASENDEWLSLSTGYVMAVFDCIRALKAWPPVLRPLAFRLLPERAAIRDQWTRARPIVAATLRARAALNAGVEGVEGKSKGDGNLESPPSCLDFLCSHKNAALAADVDRQLAYQMTLVAVGTVTTHATIVQALYDLALHPEYVPELRAELAAADVDGDGLLTKAGVASLRKMDSFVKESQRLSHPDLTTFQRAATADLRLPDGTRVPKGTKLEIATAAIYADERIYPDPAVFDGLRFYRLRQQPGHDGRHQFVSVGPHDLSFGFGTHACPGRFLGIYNTKIILAEILRRYDLRLPDGAPRPPNTEVEVIVSPDPEARILMRSRTP